MPRKSLVELEAQAAATIESNVIGAVSAADVRQMFLDFINAIRPGYGQLTIVGSKNQVVSIAPSLLTFTGQSDSNPAQTTSTFANGRIARTERGMSRINFTMDVETNSGRFVTFTLMKNGVATPWKQTINGGGSGNPVCLSFSALDYADPAATYSIFVSAEQNNTTVTFANGGFVVELVPVNVFS